MRRCAASTQWWTSDADVDRERCVHDARTRTAVSARPGREAASVQRWLTSTMSGIRRRAAMWRWVLSVVAARAARRARRARGAPGHRPLAAALAAAVDRRAARRGRGRRHVARVAPHHPPPQPHDRAPHRHRVRAAPAARRPARGGGVARRRRRRARRQRQGGRADRHARCSALVGRRSPRSSRPARGTDAGAWLATGRAERPGRTR